MADHININEPGRFDRELDHQIAAAKAQVDLTFANKRADALARDLDAIFTRIGRGDEVELHYADGRRIVIFAPPIQGELA
jgi:hypothetical protein